MRDRHFKSWTEEEESKLLYLTWKGRTDRQIATELGRTPDAVAQRRREIHKREEPPTFTIEDYEREESNHPEESNETGDRIEDPVSEDFIEESESSNETPTGLEIFFNGQKLNWKKGTRVVTEEFVIDTDPESQVQW